MTILLPFCSVSNSRCYLGSPIFVIETVVQETKSVGEVVDNGQF